MILVADHDVGTIETCAAILRAASFDVITATTGQEALASARAAEPEIVMLDVRLPDMSGLDVLRGIKEADLNSSVLMMTAFSCVRAAVDAVRLGAADYLEKPLRQEDVLRTVMRTIDKRRTLGVEEENGVPDAYGRWADLVVSALRAHSDPKTLEAWGRHHQVGRSTVESRCHGARLSAKASLDLTRLLRAIYQAQRLNCSPDLLLDADPRTVSRMFEAACITPQASCPIAVEDFLRTQQVIGDTLARKALWRAIRSRRQD